MHNDATYTIHFGCESNSKKAKTKTKLDITFDGASAIQIFGLAERTNFD